MFEVDGNSLLDMLLNTHLLNDKKFGQVIKVLNKYGITGTQAVAFILEFAAACQQTTEDKENG